MHGRDAGAGGIDAEWAVSDPGTIAYMQNSTATIACVVRGACTNTNSKWQQATNAMKSFIGSPDSRGIKASMIVFP